jgi:hypothetical protein
MKTDPIVSEVRFIRRQILESYDWDFRKMARAAIARQNSGNRPIVRTESSGPEASVSSAKQAAKL